MFWTIFGAVMLASLVTGIINLLFNFLGDYLERRRRTRIINKALSSMKSSKMDYSSWLKNAGK